jgi:hypothetical protein
MEITVVTEMAPLAGGEEIRWVAVLRLVIAVRGRQHDLAAGDRVRQPVPGTATSFVAGATLARALAPAFGAAEPDGLADLGPVAGIAPLVGGSDGAHVAAPALAR